MSRVHGFRIYVVQVFPNQKATNAAVDLSADSDGQQRLYDVLAELAGKTHFLEPAVAPKLDEPAKPTTSVTVGETYIVRPDLWHMTVSIGEFGTHPKATHRKKAPRNLDSWSAEADHFVTFAFPNDEDDRLLVIAQTQRRRDPLPALFRLLTHKGIELKKAAKALEDQIRELAEQQGIKPPKRVAHERLVFDRRQAMDNAYIDEIIGEAQSASAVFTSTVPSDRGGSGEKIRRSLRINLVDDNDRDIARKVGRLWTRRRREGDAGTQAAGVSELAAELTEHDLLDEDEGQHYNAAVINVTGKSGAATHIAVDTLRDVFTYPVSDGQPPVVYYYEKVASRLRIVAGEEAIELADLDPVEVSECLDDST